MNLTVSPESLEELAELVAAKVAARLVVAPSAPNDGLLTVAQAATYLNLTEAAVRMRVKRGQLPVTRLGRLIRFERAGLREFVLSGKAAA